MCGEFKGEIWRDAFSEYEKRLSRFCRFETVEIPESEIEREGNEILKKKAGYIAALCIEGKALSSENFAKFIEKKSFDFGIVPIGSHTFSFVKR